MPFNSVLNESSSTDVSRETSKIGGPNVSRETLLYPKGPPALGFVRLNALGIRFESQCFT
jgi:hypothetical protein